MLVEWLAPIAAFWTLAAMYLGGAPIRIEGGGGVRQLGGLAASFALYLVVFALLRPLLAGVTGPVLAVALATVGTSLLLPWECRLGFILFGVKIRKAGPGTEHGGGGHEGKQGAASPA